MYSDNDSYDEVRTQKKIQLISFKNQVKKIQKYFKLHNQKRASHSTNCQSSIYLSNGSIEPSETLFEEVNNEQMINNKQLVTFESSKILIKFKIIYREEEKKNSKFLTEN